MKLNKAIRINSPRQHHKQSQMYYFNNVTNRIIRAAGYLQHRLNNFVKYLISFFLPNKKPTPAIKDETELYIDKQMKRLVGCRSVEPNVSINANIDKTFYNREEFSKLMETPNNLLEREWQSRLLLETTPRGTIIMYYDAYKEGFAYYSDLTGIPYKLLNAIAAKYVHRFQCRDFFIDELALPNNPSPFLKLIHDEQKKEQTKKQTLMASTLVDTATLTNPFVKLKQPMNLKPIIPTTTTTTKPNIPTTTPDKVTNKFMYKGKIHNFNPLQPVKKRRPNQQKLPTQYDKFFDLEAEAQENLLSYKTFKRVTKEINA
jgi:hypothetical protein